VNHGAENGLLQVERSANQSIRHGSTGRYLPDLEPRNRSSPRQTEHGWRPLPTRSITSTLPSSARDQIHTRQTRDQTLHGHTTSGQSNALPQTKTLKSALQGRPTHLIDRGPTSGNLRESHPPNRSREAEGSIRARSGGSGTRPRARRREEVDDD
jgi:hypothetical protein